MKYTKTTCLLVMFILSIANNVGAFGREKHHCFITHGYDIFIIDQLPPMFDPSPLVFHCQSGSKDLGNQTLEFNGEFTWGFCDDVFHKTLYYCHFRWGSKYLFVDVFDKKWRDKCVTRECYWVAKNDGLYFGTFDKNFIFKQYDWKTGSVA